ncbi:hypothetical protein RJ639_046664 [Escallonia herrerae]|uniref:Peptidase A1 domain-containing protein n=1 Tax=Escallonia herrerae TaxID=1293975 RepID=A0AA89AZA8_9ASTE|nr:hypothetical protein RJ639_046664 [Escallonia herrerae]
MKPIYLSLTDAKHILVILVFLVQTNITNSTTTSTQRFATQLIHYDSILSPFYNASATIIDYATQAHERSISRLSYLNATTMVETPDDIRGVITAPPEGAFLVNMFIGQPGVQQFLVLDTGSSTTWVHCFPCIGCNSIHPIFNPSQSLTYYALPCNHDPYCAANCDHQRNWCTYSESYMDGTSNSGNFATEKFTFVIPNVGATIASNILFGCGRMVNEPHIEISGVMGLGYEEISVVTQIGTKFSYCIGSVRDPYYPYNRLIIGSGANMIGKLTPLDLHNPYYYLTLESISVGHRDLPISPRVFRRTSRGDRGVVIDSGCEWTFLIREAYVPFINTVQQIIARYVARATFPNQPTWLCYYGVASRDLIGFPIVRLNFNGGANFSLGIQNLFQAVTNRIFCLNVAEANGKTPSDVSIIGVIAQQSHNIGYDLSARMLSIDKTDCRTL